MNLTHAKPPWLNRYNHTSNSSRTLEYRLYWSFPEVSPLKDQWNQLAARTGDVFCSYDYCELWWKHFGRWRRLEIHTLHDGDQLAAVLPLFRETIHPGGVRLRTLRVLGCDYTINTVGLAIEPHYAELFLNRVLDQISSDGNWDVLQIGPLHEYYAIIEPMAQAAAAHDQVQATIIGRQDFWSTWFDLPSTYDDFLESLTSNARHDTTRRQRRLAERHQVELSAVTQPEQVQAAMDMLIQLHQRHWTSKGHAGEFGGIGAIEDFHRDLAQRLAQTGQLVLLTLKADGQILSVMYGYRFGSRTHAMLVGHTKDRQWDEFSIGRIMHCHTIRQAIDNGSTMLEDGRGVFEYKLRLGGTLHGEHSLVAVHRGWSSRLRFWAALRASYLIHVLYNRIWMDAIAPRLNMRPTARHFYVRYNALAQLHRRVRFRLFGGPAVMQTRCLEPKPAEDHRKKKTARDGVQNAAGQDQTMRARPADRPD